MRTIPPPLMRMVKERVFPEVTFRVSTLHPSFFFRQIPENGGLVCRVFVQEIQRNGNGAFPAVSVHQSNVPLVS